jgi:hypothetical protein
MAEATSAADAVEVGLGSLGEIKVDDDVYGLDIDTACEKIWERRV